MISQKAEIRVAHVLGSLDRGGVEMRTLDLVANLDKEVSTYMVTLSGREGSLAARYRAVGAKIVPLKIYSVTFPILFMLFLRRNRIDVVHSHIHHTSGFITLLAMLARVRTRIVHYRSDGHLDAALPFASRVKTLVLRKLVHASATHIIAVSPATLSIAWSESWTSDPRCSVLVNGFDLSAFKRTGQYTPPEGLGDLPRPIVLHLGRADSPSKNRDGAVSIFNRFCERNNKGTLLFVGRDGRDDVEARSNRRRWSSQTQEAGTSERVVFLGERSDVIDILHSVDVLLFTSLLEGLPGVLVEARCAGVPVVATDLPGCRFLAEKLSRVTLLGANDPVDYWVDALEETLDSPLSLDERDQALASLRGSDFDMRTVVQRYIELWSA